MKVMFMTSIHFISIQRRNSCIRSMTELIIMIGPETMDFSIEPGHSYHVAKVRKAMEHASKEVGP
jgi:hypothetical protein